MLSRKPSLATREVDTCLAIAWIVLSVECTGGELNKGDKLSKLVTRSKEITALLTDYQVYPVIAYFTS